MRKVLCKIGNEYTKDWEVEWEYLEDEYPFCKEFYTEGQWGKIVYRKLVCLEKLKEYKKMFRGE